MAKAYRRSPAGVAIRVAFWLCLGPLCLTGCATAPANYMADPEKTARIYVKLGYEYTEQGKFDLAKRKLSKAVELAPDLPEAHDALAYMFSNLDEIELADQHYLKAIQLGQGDSRWYNNYGAFLCRMGQYDEAESQFEKAISDPFYEAPAQAYENAGLCALGAQKRTKAKEYFEKALFHNPERSVSLLELTQLYYEDSDLTDAQKTLKRYFFAHDQTPRSLWLGLQIAKAENNEVGVKHYQFALRSKFPDSPEAKKLSQE